MLGAALQLETPEGIDLEVNPAGPVARGMALLIDATITGLVTIALSVTLLMAGSAGMGVFLVLYFLIEWFYPVLFEVLRGGQTPGKKVLGLRVVHADATPVGWNASLIRNLLRTVDFFPFFYLAGIVTCLFNGRFQRLGDLAANTLVVHSVDRSSATTISPEQAEEAAGVAALGARTLPVGLSGVEQRALLGYAERYAELSPERAIELAEVLEPLSGARDAEALGEVLRIANGIAGGT